jgi:hypothetical protein
MLLSLLPRAEDPWQVWHVGTVAKWEGISSVLGSECEESALESWYVKAGVPTARQVNVPASSCTLECRHVRYRSWTSVTVMAGSFKPIRLTQKWYWTGQRHPPTNAECKTDSPTDLGMVVIGTSRKQLATLI